MAKKQTFVEAVKAAILPAGPTVLIGEAHEYVEHVVDQPYKERDLVVYIDGQSYMHVADAPDGRWIYAARHLA